MYVLVNKINRIVLPLGVFQTKEAANNFLNKNNLQQFADVELVDQTDRDIGFSDMMHMDNWYNGPDGFSDFY